jgi:hypothetical protein
MAIRSLELALTVRLSPRGGVWGTSAAAVEREPSIDVDLVKDVRHRSEVYMTTITISPKFQIAIP